MTEKKVDLTNKVIPMLKDIHRKTFPDIDFMEFENRFNREGGKILIPDNMPLEEAWSHALISMPLYLVVALVQSAVEKEKEPEDFIVT